MKGKYSINNSRGKYTYCAGMWNLISEAVMLDMSGYPEFPCIFTEVALASTYLNLDKKYDKFYPIPRNVVNAVAKAYLLKLYLDGKTL